MSATTVVIWAFSAATFAEVVTFAASTSAWRSMSDWRVLVISAGVYELPASVTCATPPRCFVVAAMDLRAASTTWVLFFVMLFDIFYSSFPRPLEAWPGHTRDRARG